MPKDDFKIKALVAMGLMAEGRDGVIVEIKETHPRFTEDANTYAVDELFYDGAELPKQPGLYMFEGYSESFLDEVTHYGKFTKLKSVQLS